MARIKDQIHLATGSLTWSTGGKEVYDLGESRVGGGVSDDIVLLCESSRVRGSEVKFSAKSQ